MLTCGALWRKVGDDGEQCEKPPFGAYVMFLGEYEHNIDQKGRLAIPARFRNAFAEGLVLAQGFDKCIMVFPTARFKEWAEEINNHPLTNSNARRLNRAIFSAAFFLDLDGQGRVTLPARLRDYANVGNSVMVAGLYDHLEVWARDSWEGERALMDEQLWQIAEANPVR